MLDVAQEREVEGDLCHHDLGDGLPFRPGMFDGAISISAVQWLCNAVSSCLFMLSEGTQPYLPCMTYHKSTPAQ